MARTLNNEVDVLNIASLDNDIKDSFTRAMITEDVNTTSAASKAYAKGEYFIHTDRYLYKALTDIVVGETITPDVNAEVVTVSEELVRLFAQSPEGIFEILSNVQNGDTATRSFVKGEQIIWKDKHLYNVTADVVSGGTWTVGTNIALADNLTSQIQTLTNSVAFKSQTNGRVPQSSIDPNDITVTSLYNFTNKANLPDLGWWFVFTLVHSNDSNYITQFALKMTDDWHEICIRNKNNGVWNAWKSLATQGTYRTQTKEVTLTANAGDWSLQTVTWDVAFVETPHVTAAVSGNSYIPEPIALIEYSKTMAKVGMYQKSHNLKVRITATGWVRE